LRSALLALCLLLSAPLADAAGLNLAWNQALSEGGVNAMKFDCASDAGFSELVGTFMANQPHPAFIGCEILLDVQTESTSLPDWWQFNTEGSCRQYSANPSYDFRGLRQTVCSSPYEGSVLGPIANYVTSARPRPDFQPGPNVARFFIGVVHLPGTTSLSAGQEYFAFRLAIGHEYSAGAGACQGCLVPACLILTEIKVYDDVPIAPNGQESPPPSYERITTVAQGNLVSWQDAGPGCQPTVKNRTWGQLKSVYR